MIDLIFLLLSFQLELCVSQVGLCREQTQEETVAETSLGDSLQTTICGRDNKLGLDRRRSWIVIQSQQSGQVDP